jgi:hypothetical protein
MSSRRRNAAPKERSIQFQRQSALMPASLTMLSHLPSWTFMKAPSSSGVLENPSKPTFLNFAWTSGLSMTLRSAPESRHDRRRRSGRRDEAGPSIEIEALYSGLVHSRQVRIQ